MLQYLPLPEKHTVNSSDADVWPQVSFVWLGPDPRDALLVAQGQ